MLDGSDAIADWPLLMRWYIFTASGIVLGYGFTMGRGWGLAIRNTRAK